jgi:hypothetical protein
MEFISFTILQWAHDFNHYLLQPTGKSFSEFDWIPVCIFYALDPMVKLIPRGASLFRAVQKQSFPYKTEKIEYVFNTFEAIHDTQNIYFIAFNQPTPDVVKLPFIPVEDEGEVFVLPEPMGFELVQGRCIPWKKSVQTVRNCLKK